MSERTRVISANDMHVIMTQCLNAAKNIQIAMCRFSDDHAGQEYLNQAMHAALVGAEQCRQLHKSKKERLAPQPEDDVGGTITPSAPAASTPSPRPRE